MNATNHAMQSALSAMPLGFQSEPVMSAVFNAETVLRMQINRLKAQTEAQAAKLKEQGARIDALQASVAHEIAKNEALEDALRWANECSAGYQAAMKPPVRPTGDEVLRITVNDVEYVCSFYHANEPGDPLRLELRECWGIGAVPITGMNIADLAVSLERAAEAQLTEEAQELRADMAIDAYEFDRAYA